MEEYNKFKSLEEANKSLGFEPIGNNIPLRDFFSHGKCECGYAPHDKVDKKIIRLMKKNRGKYRDSIAAIEDNLFRENNCDIKSGLENHITFPPVTLLSDSNETSDLYYDTKTGNPKRHWALVLEINHLLYHPSRIGFGGFNLYGDEIHVYFECDKDVKPTTFSWSDLKDGNTMAILYAEQRRFPNGDSMVVESNLDSCFIFRESLEMVRSEANQLISDADLMAMNSPSSCFSCGYSNSAQTLNRCANCKLAKFCSKECQSYSWKESHKRLCDQDETLLRLASLPLLPFEDFFTFRPDEPMSLPAYRPTRTKKNTRPSSFSLSCENKENKMIGMGCLSKMLERKCDLKMKGEEGSYQDEPRLESEGTV